MGNIRGQVRVRTPFSSARSKQLSSVAMTGVLPQCLQMSKSCCFILNAESYNESMVYKRQYIITPLLLHHSLQRYLILLSCYLLTLILLCTYSDNVMTNRLHSLFTLQRIKVTERQNKVKYIVTHQNSLGYVRIISPDY